MGKTTKLYLAKRMLAMILAVAMSVTMVPQTVFAAPADDTAVEDVVNAAAEKSDTDTPADDDVPADGTEQKDAGDTVADGTAADDAGGDTSDAGVVKGSDGSADVTNTTGDDATIGSDAENTDQEPADGGNTEIKAEPNAEGDTSAATYEISIGDMETEAVYNGYAPFDTNLAVLKKTENGETTDVEGETPTAAWKVKGEDGNFTALTGAPVNAGEYELTLTCAAVAGVHDAVTSQPVTCKIEEAPLTVKATANAKPGDKADKANVTVTVDDVIAAYPDQTVLTSDVIALEVTGIRNAYGSSLTADDKLQKDGDYVVDITPSLKADAPAAAKEAEKNYKIEPFTADVVMGELTETRIVVTLADKWKETETITRVYDGKPADAPEATVDYTCEVQSLDETTTPATWKNLEGAVAVGGWKEYEGCKKKEDGTVEPPTDAGTYYYGFTYEDKTGVYADSASDSDSNTITVVIKPATVTVGITNTAEIKVPVDTAMTKVLSQVKYEAKTVDSAEKPVTINPAENHIWGTGYNDSNVSQIYEPAFTLQVKDGQTWKSISDADYRMEGGKEYRIIYDGKKAIYNADGSYAHRTDINSGLDENGEEINGVSSNYLTDITPTADDKALTVTVEPGIEMEWDLETLLKDGKAGDTPETADANETEYDNTPLYASRSDYKNKIKLKGTDSSKTLNAIGSDFTYTWYKNDAEDLLDKEILDQNQANGFTSYGFEDGWNKLGNIVAPTGAGIYKLEIAYEDNTDDGTFYYVKDGKPAVVYFVINKVQLTIKLEGEYSTLSGGTPYEFFVRENKIDELDKKCILQDENGNVYKIPSNVGELVPQWGVLVHVTDEAGVPSVQWFPEYSERHEFTVEAGTTYEIQARDVGYRSYVGGEYDDFWSNENYTLYSSQKKQTDVGGKMRAEREDTLLSDKVPLTVKPMGTTALTITPTETPAEFKKTFNGEVFPEQERNQKLKSAYTLTKTENGQQVPVEEDPGVRYLCVNKTNTDDECMLEDLSNAGEYNLYACFWGDETYAPLDLGPEPVTVPGVLIGTVEIYKRPVTLQLKVDDTYQAGSISALMDDINAAYRVTGYEECDDEWAFRHDEDGYAEAWEDIPNFLVYEKGSKTPLTENVLHRNKEYEIHYDVENSALSNDYCARNYEVTTTADESLCTFETVAAPAQIRSVSAADVRGLSIATTEQKWDNGNVSQTVEVQEGISYSTYSRDDAYGESVDMKGNLAAFAIYAPAEFNRQIPETAMYRNQVEKVGGRVIAEYSNRFVVLFDAAKGEKSFAIRWEDKYVETIKLNFNKEQCLGNLRDAVAPKSLAFNAAPKKLAIGASVQLDVKITKAQMADVICLGYKSSDESVMHVNPESGYVTALKKGKATITVYPQHMDESGKMVPIVGAKTATATIEGTTVTAPKPVKVTTHGAYADVDYGTVADGYRREIYVVTGKQNAKDIEVKVKNLQGNKNQWRNDFVIAPIYQDSADERLNRSRYDYTARLTGLQTDTQYTVYVRNVCEAKTLSDGNVITQSTVDASAAGTAVTFKTLKSEAIALDLKLDETVDGITDVTGYSTVPAFYSRTRTYVVDFSKFAKGLDSKTLGRFYLNASDSAADSSDYLDLELPIKDKKYTGVYQNPKLEYYVWATDKNGDRVRAQKNDFVSIDKKGKIKLTGVSGYYDWEDDSYYGGAYIYAYDSSLNETAAIHLIINADVDSVTAKKKTVNLSVGQRVDLNDIALYNYKAGNKKLTGYHGPDMDMGAVRTAVQAQKDYFRLEGTDLIAIKGGGKLELSLTDKNVKNNVNNAAKPETNATAKITFVSKDLAPVKKIKGIDITNDQFGLTFTHAGEAEAFRVEIIDSSNKKLLDKQYQRNDGAYEVWAVSGNKDRRVKDTYRIDAWQIQRDVLAGGGKIAKESQYTVKISALYEGVSTKPATGKVKTTKIPAQGGYLEDYYKRDGSEEPYDDRSGNLVYDENGKVILVKPRGGMSISVSEGNMRLHDTEYDEGGDEIGAITTLRVLSGNSYTLTANPSNRGRVNDTLVWTIGDKKVASVKAAAGTYCITLKGLKPGSTVLEVKSKILGNKVIARYDIYVVAVGDAYKNSNGSTRYYGDDEPEDWNNPTTPGKTGDNAPEYLPLSVGDPRKVSEWEDEDSYSYFSFTAPETAKYRFSTTGDFCDLFMSTSKTSGWQYTSSNLGWLEGGTTIYLISSIGGSDVNSAYYVEIELTQRMEQAENGKTVTGQGNPASFEFKAPETGQYQFSLSYGNNSKETLYLYTNVQDAMNQNSNYSDNGQMVEAQLQEGESVWLTTRTALRNGVEYTLNAKKISEDVTFGTPKQVTLAAGEATYLMYTIGKSGRYQFSAAADSVSYYVSGEITVNGERKTSISATDFDTKLELNQGDVVCVKVTNDGSADVTFTVNTADITPADLSTATGDVTISGGDTFYTFTASTAGAYKFTMTVDQASRYDVELKIWNSVSDAENYGYPLVEGTAGDVVDDKVTISADILLAAGQTVYVNPVNNSGSEMTVGVAGAEDTSIPKITAAGTSITLQANQKMKAIFTAGSTGIYTFATGDLTETVTFELQKDGGSTGESIEVYSGDSLSKKVFLRSGQLVMWTMETYAETNLSLNVALKEELKLGQSIQASISAGEADGFVFTAPDSGTYTFWADGDEDTYGILYDIDSVDANTCLAHNGRNDAGCITRNDSSGPGSDNFAITVNLNKGQTVYLKSMFYSSGNTGSFPVNVGQGSQPWYN